MHLEIITPQQHIFSGEAKSVSLPTQTGEITILPDHMPLVTSIKSGILSFIPEDSSLIEQGTFVFNEKSITLPVADGIAHIDGEKVTVMISFSALTNDKTKEELETEKAQIEKEIQVLKNKESEEEGRDNKEQRAKLEKKLSLIETQIKFDTIQTK